MELNDLLAELGQPAVTEPPAPEPNAPADPPITDPAPIEEPVNNDVPGAATPTEPIIDNGQVKDTDPSSSAPSPTNKVNKAFAEMRVQNQQYQKTLNQLGQLLGAQDTKDPNAILDLVQTQIIQAQAKQQNVPVDLLQRLDFLENQYNQNQQQTVQQQAMLGFQNVKNQFGLNDSDLNTFADELAGQGINPFAQQVNLVDVYKNLHFDDLVQKQVEKALQAERVRALKAAQNSSTPNNATGTNGDQSQAKVTDARSLEAWFNKQTK